MKRKVDMPFAEFEIIEFDEHGNEIDEPFPFECGYIPEEGVCMKAGTEECDWDCPYRDRIEKSLKKGDAP